MSMGRYVLLIFNVYAEHQSLPPSSPRISPLLLWFSAALAVVATIDLLAIVHVVRMFDTVFQDKDFAANLEYANPYIGLKELYDSGKVKPSKVDPILISPRLSGQVYVDEPDRLAPRGEHDYWSPMWGMLSPHEHHLYVTSKVWNVWTAPILSTLTFA